MHDTLELHVSIRHQRLSRCRNGVVERIYRISTARNGLGELAGSECPPRGWHRVRAYSLRRYIYIHGTAEETRLGTPASHGCIRMSSADVIDLFDHVQPGTRVYIAE